uniref:GRANULINS domain-containing protein n=1 Tax=Globodera pallida TaxID=36090 RepID=A0A183CNQ3_GLOPA
MGELSFGVAQISEMLHIIISILSPFPLELSLSQKCKEVGQMQCQDSCGWASCVAASDTFFNTHDQCCPRGYKFKCCSMLPQMKYSFVYKYTAVMFREMEEKCKDKSGFCLCKPHLSITNGMCCYANGGCGCCSDANEPTIGKLPK